jgi:hypothetical protein
MRFQICPMSCTFARSDLRLQARGTFVLHPHSSLPPVLLPRCGGVAQGALRMITLVDRREGRAVEMQSVARGVGWTRTVNGGCDDERGFS